MPRSRALVDLGAVDLVLAEDVLLGPHVRALMLRLAERDAYTEQHTRRVAVLAARVASSSGSRRGGCARSRSAGSRRGRAAGGVTSRRHRRGARTMRACCA
jgi:HD-GYP domain-containing protein (c-di-GMP phosphodiesterase class II)